MSVTVYLSGYLRPFSGGETEIVLDGDFSAVGDVLDSLWLRHRALRDRVLTETGEIRKHVNIFIGNDDVKRKRGLDTPLTLGEIHIFNAVSGG